MALKKKKTPKKPRNRAAQEATLINIRALKRRVSTLEASRKSDVDRLDNQERSIVGLQKTVLQLSKDLQSTRSLVTTEPEPK